MEEMITPKTVPVVTSVKFKNIRCLPDVVFPLTRFTILTGDNGVGKSTVLDGVFSLYGSGSLPANLLTAGEEEGSISATRISGVTDTVLLFDCLDSGYAKMNSVCYHFDFITSAVHVSFNPLWVLERCKKAVQVIVPDVTNISTRFGDNDLGVTFSNESYRTASKCGSGVIALTNLVVWCSRMEAFINTKPVDKPAFILIDGIGDGFHYSHMLRLWEMIHEWADKMPQVQFVCTSHSRDCIEAFSKHFANSDDAQIVRLYKRQLDNAVVPTIYNKEYGFAQIVNGDLEVRG
jgi:hypothetical protein